MIGRKLVIAVSSAAVAGSLSAVVAFASGATASMSGNAGSHSSFVAIDTNSGTGAVAYDGHGYSVNLLDVPNQDSIQAAIDWAKDKGVPGAERTINEAERGAGQRVDDSQFDTEQAVNDAVGKGETAANDAVGTGEQPVNTKLGDAETAVNNAMASGEKELNSVHVTPASVSTSPSGVLVGGGSVSVGLPTLP